MNVKKLIFFALCAAACGARADVEAKLTRDGHVTFGDTGLVLLPVVYVEGWHGTVSARAPKYNSFPNAKSGTVSWNLKGSRDARLGHGTTRLVAAPDGRASFRAEFVSDADQRPEGVLLCLNLPAARYGGLAWTADARTGVFPPTYTPGKVSIFSGKVRRVSLALPGGGSIDFAFDEPTAVHLQDSRRWGDNFALRIGSGRVPFGKGTTRVVAGTVGASSPVRVAYASPTRILPGDDWVPLDYKKDILAGSALDFSAMGLQDAPAGKYGWLKNVGGHFEFEKLPGVSQRFYGVNFCFTGNYPTHEQADQIVTRLVRLGYNAIRVHHYERDLVGMKGGFEFKPEMIDRLDYFLAAAIRHGLYVTTDLFVSRPVAWKDVGLAERGPGLIPEKSFYKCLVALWDPAFEDWKKFSEKFLLHVNPYTGRRYLDEPAMPLISLINEGQLTMGWTRKNYAAREDPIIRDAWTKWLAERRAADPAFCPDAPTVAQDVSSYGTNNAAFAHFMADVERRSASRMIAFLRKLGSRALFTNANCGPHLTPMQFTREACYDYVDDHFYVDHPRFLEKSWALPARVGNSNPVLSLQLPPTRVAFTRLADKPFTITEWNFSGPCMFRGVGGIMTGAFSALQDWDGLWRFSYTHSSSDIADGKGTPAYFNTSTDPLGQASDRASVCLFLRRDLAPLTAAETYLVTDAALQKAGGRALTDAPSWSDAAWDRQVSTSVDATKVRPGTVVRPLAETHAVSNAPFARAPNAAFALDRERGTFTIDTPRTSGGFAPEGALACGAVSFTVHDAPATVWASSVDADATPIRRARRILVSHLTDVQASGNLYEDASRQVLLKWGTTPPIVRVGSADISIALDEPARYTVYALDTSGARLAPVPCRAEGGKLSFTASVRGPEGARMLYEVVRTSDQ